jgi:nicotinate dehydrogenase subunit B
MTDLLTEKTFSRRRFVQGSGALVVGFSLAGGSSRANAASSARGDDTNPPDPNNIDSFVQINADNTATVYFGKIELGQGNTTGLLQIAAEELDMDMSQVKKVRHTTGVTPDQGFTFGSQSIANAGPQVRAAAAEARQALLQIASTKLGVPTSALAVSKGVVTGNGKSVSYGDLLGGKLFNMKMTGTAPQKPVSSYKVVGTRVPRIDIPDKVTGRYTYVHNVRIPGMLHGRIVRPKGQGPYGEPLKPLSVDLKSIKQFKHVQVIRRGDFVGVVAPREYDAIQAAAALKVKWDLKPTLPGNGNIYHALKNNPNLVDRPNVNTGNVDGAWGSAVKTAQGSFEYPYQMHGALGPTAAIADVKKSGATILSSTQGAYGLRGTLAKTLQMDPTQIQVQYWEGSGCYGHNCLDDVAHAAAVMSQETGKPVRVQFMRWDEHGWDNYGPPVLAEVRAGVDANGKIVAYDYLSYNHGSMSLDTTQEQIGLPLPAAGNGSADAANAGGQYAITNRRVAGKSAGMLTGSFLKSSYLRAPGAPQALFASEQIIDELAHLAGMDPIAFRIANAGNDRWTGVLNAAAQAANWTPRVANSVKQSGAVLKGRGVGIGGFASTYAAVIAEIEVNTKTGKIRATHMVGAQDCGLAVNPGLVENQIEGCLIQGTSRALVEEVRFDKQKVTSTDWSSYPILRFKDAPAVTPIVVQRADLKSSGSGEPTTAPVAAAIANAFFDATGVRIRQAPMTPGRVRAVLAAAK